eukprot:6029592-Amphidinium_carterae.1
MDPSPDEVARWASAEHVASWAGLSGSIGDSSTALGSLWATLGLHGGEHWRLLALMPRSVIDERVGAWKIGVEQERVAPSAAIVAMAH